MTGLMHEKDVQVTGKCDDEAAIQILCLYVQLEVAMSGICFLLFVVLC